MNKPMKDLFERLAQELDSSLDCEIRVQKDGSIRVKRVRVRGK